MANDDWRQEYLDRAEKLCLELAKEKAELESKLDTAIKLITQARAGLNHVGVVSNIDVWTAEADIFLEAQK